jgi:hypothetical protein
MSRASCIAAEHHQLHDEAEGSDGSPLAAPHKEFVHPVPALQRYYAVGMFCVVAALLYADQNLMAPNLTQMAAEFGFNDVVRLLMKEWQQAHALLECLPGALLHVAAVGAVTDGVSCSTCARRRRTSTWGAGSGQRSFWSARPLPYSWATSATGTTGAPCSSGSSSWVRACATAQDLMLKFVRFTRLLPPFMFPPFPPSSSNIGLCAAGEAPCIMTIFVRSYWELLLLRLLTGISLGGIFPLVGAPPTRPFSRAHSAAVSATFWHHSQALTVHIQLNDRCEQSPFLDHRCSA